ncbi:G-type lectin S-receptor-like serine/threonine-protein kinase SD2-5 [Tanacetum coccineum]
MNLTDTGNLVLFDVHGLVIWQSFDHPTDCLLPGQKLLKSQKLIASVSSTNWTTQQSLYAFKLSHDGFYAYFEVNPLPYSYYGVEESIYVANGTIKTLSYDEFLNGSLFSFYKDYEYGPVRSTYNIPFASSTQYMKLMSDGHLKVFEWQEGWTEVADLLTNEFGKCDTYPMACGRNSLCIGDGQCSCPGSSSYPVTGYFRAVNDHEPYLGCYESNPLTYKSMNNCSCKAVIVQYGTYDDDNNVTCHLLSELFTLSNVNPNYKASAFIKVQNVRSASLSPSHKVVTIIGSTIGSFLLLLVVSLACYMMLVVRKRRKYAEMEEEYLDQVPGMPTRFSYKVLECAIGNFTKKLGEGGFGTVFEGILEDGSKIAVKCLEGHRHVKRSFLAEVESIGSIHHVNLVRLRGFCAWKSQRLLVYEFMSNGSLDRWIYHGVREHVLDWECIKKVILDVAKGLAYLHEDCRQRIIHLDIKPQNILLDSDFNAKVSDFGLSKLIDRNQKQVMTTMRGTPGYLAPEWLSSVITEKADVYSFGIVLLEILCGRKNFDISQPEEKRHLLGMFQKCWEQGTLRPSMSSVVRVLKGGTNVELNLDYNFTDPRMHRAASEHEKDMTQLLPSFLSGPRVDMCIKSSTLQSFRSACLFIRARVLNISSWVFISDDEDAMSMLV